MPSSDIGGTKEFFRGKLFSFPARGTFLGQGKAKHTLL